MSKRLNNNIEKNIENKKIKLENNITEEDINNISNNYINYIQELYDYYKKNNSSNILLQKKDMINKFKDFIINNYKKIKQYSFDEIKKYHYIYYNKFKLFLKEIKCKINDYYKYQYLIREFKKLFYSFAYEEIFNNCNYFKIIFIRLSLLYSFLYYDSKYYYDDNYDRLSLLNIFIISL